MATTVPSALKEIDPPKKSSELAPLISWLIFSQLACPMQTMDIIITNVNFLIVRFFFVLID